jgi:hypothetical protein
MGAQLLQLLLLLLVWMLRQLLVCMLLLMGGGFLGSFSVRLGGAGAENVSDSLCGLVLVADQLDVGANL